MPVPIRSKRFAFLSDKSTIPFESLKPDFTDETFKKIKESTKSKAYETRSYEEGVTFKKTHTYSEYVQNRHFDIIKKDILHRLDVLKNSLVENLEDFVENIRTKYIAELSNNANAKKAELDAIMDAKNTAEQIQDIIKELTSKTDELSAAQSDVKKIKGGISKYVQHNN